MRLFRAFAAVCLLSLTACPSLGALLRQYGYTEVKTPSTLLEPGTVVWVKQTNPFSAGVVCTRAESLGANFVPTQAPTASSQLNKAVNTTVTAGADYMSLIHGEAAFSDITDITVRLSNPTIHSLTDTDILLNAGRRSRACERAIAARRVAGFTVTMITSALQADVTYTANFKESTKLSAQARTELLKDLSARAGLEAARVSDSSIQGNNLFWGVMDDKYLANLADNVVADENERGQHLLPTEDIASLDLVADTRK